MIVDLRTYTCKPGSMDKFVALYKEMAWPLQQKYLGRCLGWYTTIEGRQNTITHLWAYDSQNDREQRRKLMIADPAFTAYLKAVTEADVLVDMENRIVAPTSFSP